jgi:GT2 family glycosyltransferase
MKLSVIIACHNRKELTIQCVERARDAAVRADAAISFTVFDDGSSDGTGEALSQLPVSLSIIRGDGSAYWASSMATAEETVMKKDTFNDSDFILWLNDDVVLDDDAFIRLTACAADHSDSVLVGAMRDPVSGTVSYSGLRRSGAHPLRFQRVDASAEVQAIETFNGNLVLVPGHVALRLGGIDGGFSHGLADIDYGLRCARAGIPVVQAPGTYGSCSLNPPPAKGSLVQEWNRFIGPKGGGNFDSLRRVLRKTNRKSWLVYVSVTYGLWWIREIKRRAGTRVKGFAWPVRS